jgi:hypothetical protein
MFCLSDISHTDVNRTHGTNSGGIATNTREQVEQDLGRPRHRTDAFYSKMQAEAAWQRGFADSRTCFSHAKKRSSCQPYHIQMLRQALLYRKTRDIVHEYLRKHDIVINLASVQYKPARGFCRSRVERQAVTVQRTLLGLLCSPILRASHLYITLLPSGTPAPSIRFVMLHFASRPHPYNHYHCYHPIALRASLPRTYPRYSSSNSITGPLLSC